MEQFRKLNERGVREFKSYILALKAGGTSAPPTHLCYDADTSEALPFDCNPDDPDFNDRVGMGKALVDLIGENKDSILYDVGFWSALALVWFDKICPPDANGKRKSRAIDRYVFVNNQLKASRHILWGAWWAISLGPNGEFFLRPQDASKSEELDYLGPMMDRLAVNQKVASVPAIIELSRSLYEDPETKCLKAGASSRNKGGSPDHLVRLLKQFEMTYDFHNMSPKALRGLLPDDFNKWDVVT